MLNYEELSAAKLDLTTKKIGIIASSLISLGLWTLPYTNNTPRWIKTLSFFAAPVVSLASLSLSFKLDPLEADYEHHRDIYEDKKLTQLTYISMAEDIEIRETLFPAPKQLTEADAAKPSTSRQAAHSGKLAFAIDPFANASFPVEDLAQLVAINSLDRRDCRSILVAAPSGTGKSNLIRACVSATDKLAAGHADFSVLNAKEDRDENGDLLSTYCGLEKSPQDYIHWGDPVNIPEGSRRLAGITQKMESRSAGMPLITISDEHNNALIAAAIADKQGEKTSYWEDITTNVKLQVTKGRSRMTCLWMTAHTPFVEDIELNSGLQESLSVIVLARGDRLDAIHSALRGTRAIVKNPVVRKTLWDEFTQWELTNQDMDVVVALTNLRGKWRLVSLPHYPDVQPDITPSAINVPVSQVVDVPASVPVQAPVQQEKKEKEVDPYAYRYECEPLSWPSISKVTLALTGGLCCYPGCEEEAYQAHHVHYMMGDQLITKLPQSGRDVFGLCRRHHSDRNDPQCAHHPTNWIQGEMQEPLHADSRNTIEYKRLLHQGWLQKTLAQGRRTTAV